MSSTTVPGETVFHAEIPLPCERELLAEARAICRRRLTADPRRAYELNLLGLLAERASSRDFAVRCLARAVEIEPANAQYLNDLATALNRCGRFREATTASLAVTKLEPERKDHLLTLARALRGGEQLASSAAMYEDYLQAHPDDASAKAELAEIYEAQGQPVEAIERFQGSLALEPRPKVRAALYGRIARVHLAARDLPRAIEVIHEGLREDANVGELHFLLGRALMALGQFEEAVRAFRDGLNIDTMNPEATSQLVTALEFLGKRQDASRAWLHLGITLAARDAFVEAAAACRQALARKPDCLEALLLLGEAEIMQRHPERAIAPLRAALTIEPIHITGHFLLGRALHQVGDWHGGWDEFGWLSDERRTKNWRVFEQPRWDGTSLEGKSILFFAGQDYGLGDTLQLARFAKHLRRRDARVILECQPALAPLLARMSEPVHVAAQGMPLRAFDVYAPMMWVPSVDRAARELRDSDVPYLSADPELVEQWGQRMAAVEPGTRRVGLCWGGKSDRRDAHRRFAALSTFAPLAQVTSIHLVSLQMSPQADELFCPPPGMEVEALLDDDSAIDDTAAIMAHLDLVISVDTMVLHLAGGLGRPAWGVLPFHGGDWRWLNGECTCWYPSVRLFRQHQQAEWVGVIEEVRTALAQWAAGSPCREGEGRERANTGNGQDLARPGGPT